MSEMPRLRHVPPPAADHAGHDPLLIARSAAGDPLDEAEARQAQQLVSTCPECALLASDLRALSRVVAWEPVPARRRDFRIDAAAAERLRGSPLRRFVRRLSLPQSTSLRPAAAGIMSVGLLLVVAGNVWPEEAPGVTISDPSALPAPSAAGVLREVVEEPEAGQVDVVEADENGPLEADRTEPPVADDMAEAPATRGLADDIDGPVTPPEPDQVAASEAQAGFEEEGELADGAAALELRGQEVPQDEVARDAVAEDAEARADVGRSGLGTDVSEGMVAESEALVSFAPEAPVSIAPEAFVPVPSLAAAYAAAETVVPEKALGAAVDESFRIDDLDAQRALRVAASPTAALEVAAKQELADGPDSETPGAPRATAAAGLGAATSAPGDDLRAEGLGEAILPDAAPADVAPAEAAQTGGLISPSSGGPTIESALVVAGIVLLVAGAVLLLLVWLGRRTADPLLR